MRPSSKKRSILTAVLSTLLLPACQTPAHPPLQTASSVDIPRFMGDWYVIANIPTRIERNAYNAVESYRLDKDGRVLTTFTFHEGSFDGPLKRYNPVGFVKEGSRGAVWGMRFVWPIKADYRVMYVDAGYSQTVIGREKRDYAWIMARTATLSDSDYQRLSALLQSQGYDTSQLRKVPQELRAAPER
jgi:apolipoprotein D and lipocalin family protein